MARVIAHDKVGEPIRKRAYAYKARRPKVGGWLNALVTCPYCLSVYFAIAAVAWTTWLILPTWPGIGEFLVAWAAVAGAAALMVGADMTATKYVDS